MGTKLQLLQVELFNTMPQATPYLAAAVCQGAQEEVPYGRLPAEAHPASSTTQARQAWSPSAEAGEPSKTILD